MAPAMEEVLPAGVGRVPKWWMEITPHYTLDEEDAEARRMAEDQMAFYYMQLAAADEAGYLLPDGTPKLGTDMKPLTWTPLTPWNGRGDAKGGAAGAGAAGPGGRNFKPGHAVIDPKLFGILESDPNYKAYLTGAKLPPGYFEKMGQLANSEMGGTEGILNNLKQTDYGRYGRQAEAPNFKPVWAKKKLRETTTGANIRQGQYNDSPNKFVNRRRVEPNETPPKIPTSIGHDDSPAEEAPPQAPAATMASVLSQIQQNTVAKPVEESTVAAPVKEERKTWSHSDYYYNAKQQQQPKAATTVSSSTATPDISEQERKLKEQQEKLKRLQELQRQQQELLKAQQEQAAIARQKQQQAEEQDAAAAALQKKQEQLQKLQQLQALQALQQQQQQQQMQQAQQQQQQVQQQQQHYDEESYEEEEVIDDDCTEGSYEEEEIIEDEDDNNNELNDLQAILAAKQAELQRLQAQMS